MLVSFTRLVDFKSYLQAKSGFISSITCLIPHTKYTVSHPKNHRAKHFQKSMIVAIDTAKNVFYIY